MILLIKFKLSPKTSIQIFFYFVHGRVKRIINPIHVPFARGPHLKKFPLAGAFNKRHLTNLFKHLNLSQELRHIPLMADNITLFLLDDLKRQLLMAVTVKNLHNQKQIWVNRSHCHINSNILTLDLFNSAVEITFKQTVLNNAVFIEFFLGKRLGNLRADLARIIQNITLVKP